MDPQLRATALEQAANLHRFFLGWRQASFYGFVIAVYNVVVFAIDHWPNRAEVGWMLLTAAPLGILLAIFENRTRALYYLTTTAARAIEDPDAEMPDPLPGKPTIPKFLFAALNMKPGDIPQGTMGPHSFWLIVAYLTYSGAFGVAAIVLLCVPK